MKVGEILGGGGEGGGGHGPTADCRLDHIK